MPAFQFQSCSAKSKYGRFDFKCKLNQTSPTSLLNLSFYTLHSLLCTLVSKGQAVFLLWQIVVWTQETIFPPSWCFYPLPVLLSCRKHISEDFRLACTILYNTPQHKFGLCFCQFFCCFMAQALAAPLHLCRNLICFFPKQKQEGYSVDTEFYDLFLFPSIHAWLLGQIISTGIYPSIHPLMHHLKKVHTANTFSFW